MRRIFNLQTMDVCDRKFKNPLAAPATVQRLFYYYERKKEKKERENGFLEQNPNGWNINS